jgi:poly-gamma-glutamate capsule biosynthesis protein CapA/YwtB (metallophosphatase superfamily)
VVAEVSVAGIDQIIVIVITWWGAEWRSTSAVAKGVAHVGYDAQCSEILALGCGMVQGKL